MSRGPDTFLGPCVCKFLMDESLTPTLSPQGQGSFDMVQSSVYDSFRIGFLMFDQFAAYQRASPLNILGRFPEKDDESLVFVRGA